MKTNLFIITLFVTFPLLAKYTCDIKLVEQVPAARLQLKPGADFNSDEAGKISYNENDLVKLTELNNQKFSGDLNAYTVYADENYALAIQNVVLGTARYSTDLICTGPVRIDGFCNVAMVEEKSNGSVLVGFGTMKHTSLDQKLSGRYKSIEYYSFVNFGYNPASGVIRNHFNMAGIFNGIPRDQSQMKLLMQPNQTHYVGALNQYFGNLEDANFDITDDSGQGPRELSLEVSCSQQVK